jgi:hypothetical protein
MGRLETNQVNQSPRRLAWWAGIVPAALGLCVLVSGTAQAAGFRAPEACQGLTGQEHLNCLYTYIGIRDDNPEAATDRQNPADDTQTQKEQEMLDQLLEQRDQVDRMESGGVDRTGSGRHEPTRGPAARPETPSTGAASAPPPPATTPGFGSPFECRAYTGNAHLNCLYAYIDIQRSQAGKVDEELRAQKETLGQLRNQVDRQQSLQEQAASSPPPATAYLAPPIYPGYGYPGFGYPGYGYLGLGYSTPGLSLYLGSPGFLYGRSFYGPRFFGPRFYGPRVYGPRVGHRHR